MTANRDETARRSGDAKTSHTHQILLDRFRRTFPDAPEALIARAPGRVNIIGEHTDYNGLPVMPMAIDREIAIAFSPSHEPQIDLVSVEESYPRAGFELSAGIPPDETGHWGNYARAAAQAIWQWAEAHAPDSLPLHGYRGCVAGSIPAGAGLSSSSALVVAVALALVRVNSLLVDDLELAETLARGERYVGTEGGGMDQAASILAEAGSALKIDFYPLRARPVRLPAGHSVVIANSMVVASKTGGARVAFNTRVAECRIGLEMLKRDAAGVSGIAGARLLQDFVRLVPDWRAALDALPDGPVLPADAAARAGLSEEQLVSTCLRRKDGEVIPTPAGGFQPKRRVRHVLTEYGRVEDAVRACERGDSAALGRLMSESHESCAVDYDVSCPELDVLVSSLLRNGALGARLTGAGFGGCAVALVRSDDAQALMERVWFDYYAGYLPTRGVEVLDESGQVVFACEPSAGAGVLHYAPND